MSDQLRDVTLRLLGEKTLDEKGRGWKLRVVQWIKGDESKSVLLEKRDYFRDEYGQVKMGKARGFSLKDLEAVKEHWREVIELMKNPPAVTAAPPEEQKAQDEVPW